MKWLFEMLVGIHLVKGVIPWSDLLIKYCVKQHISCFMFNAVLSSGINVQIYIVNILKRDIYCFPKFLNFILGGGAVLHISRV